MRTRTPPRLKPTVAIVGCGVIGRGWALVFARAGLATRLYDQEAGRSAAAVEWVHDVLRQEQRDGLRTARAVAAVMARISIHPTLAKAVRGATYVQENAPEDLRLKQGVFAELDTLAAPRAILASSTSTYDMTVIAHWLTRKGRCVIAHPVNPPHQVPVVEVLGGKDTRPSVVRTAVRLLQSTGQRPVVLRQFAPGFVLNRLQFALVREAMHLVQTGVADVAAIDAIVHDGLGLRWAVLGPFGVADSNHDAGIRGYYRGHEQWTMDLMNTLGPTPTIDPAFIEQLGRGVDRGFRGISRADVRRWRDSMLRRLQALKAGAPVKSRFRRSGPDRMPRRAATL